MRKLSLVAMRYDYDAVLNALQKTNAAQITTHESCNALPVEVDASALNERLNALESALETLVAESEAYAKAHKLDFEAVKDGFEVSYTQFMQAGEYENKAAETAEHINRILSDRNEAVAERSRLARAEKTAAPYAALKTPFSSFCGTAHTACKLGVIPALKWDDVVSALPSLSAYTVLGKGENNLVAVCYHKSVAKEVETLLSQEGFTACPYGGGFTGEEQFASVIEKQKQADSRVEKLEEELFSLSGEIQPLKLYCDYLLFTLEKAQSAEKMLQTKRTLLLEAYVPKEQEENVKAELSSVSGAIYMEFSDPKEEETVPTLLKNNAVVESFESVTNMYSVPSYREMDPNTIMSFFYSLFLGFIMADVFYGVLMIVGGLFIRFKQGKRKNGLKSIATVFSVGGVFAIIWGFLFNSFCGISMPIPTLLPDAQTGMWSFIGISVPSVLVIAMLVGVVQLFAGYVCRMVQCIRWGRTLDGVLDGGVWAVFMAGVELALIGLVDEFNLANLAYIGAVMAVCALVVAILTAGRKEKFLGKFTKGFGALYSIINIVSDILSYARLYGLMLSGAVIAQIISQYAVQFITTSVPLAILGVLLMVVGHVFNIAISLLGAYIHDARLQYVEFYGRFYVGDGELFTPIGSTQKHVWINRETAVAA